jgi:tetratricopeptide (TPR) repeat protein
MPTKPDPSQAAAADTVRMETDADGGRNKTPPAPADTVMAPPGGEPVRPSAPNVGSGTGPAGEPQRGDVIDRFVILGVLGSGGMGLVYSAYDPHLDRKVAIKLLRADVDGSAADGRVRLLREAQAMAKINHPNVITVHEVGTYGEQVYVAMEFADGGNVREWLLAGKRTRREILDVFVQAGRGLVAAHGAGLVHRDFKPDNVLLGSDGSVRVTDFGIVGVADEARTRRSVTDNELAAESVRSLTGLTPISQQLTRPGAIMGTPIYMAPEQFQGLVATARADQFSFCASLYDALYGERPFAGKTYEELERNVLAGRVSPAPKTSDVPGWLRRVVVRGLAVRPDDRHASMEDLLVALAPAKQARRWIAAGVAVAGIAAVTGVIALRSDPGDECSAGAGRFDAVWNAERRDKMKAAFAATNRPHAAATFERLGPILDGWGTTWKAGHVAACEDTHAHHTQSATLLDHRIQCLERRLGDTRATVELLLAGGGDAVDHALEAALALPSVKLCADAAALMSVVPPPETEAMRVKVEDVRERLDEVRGLRRLGRFADALTAGKAALAAARATKYKPVEAEALLVVGRLEMDQGEPAGIATLGEAMRAAAESGDERGMVDAATHLVFRFAMDGQPYAHTLEVATLAEAFGRHARITAEAQVNLESAIGMMHEANADPAAAQVRHEKALALAEKEIGPDSQAAVTALTQLGNLARTQGRFADARGLLERALAIQERVYGASHPHVADSLNNLGIVHRVEGNLEAAKALFDRALSVRVAALGPEHPEVATSHNNLGTYLHEQGDLVKADEAFMKALRIWEKVYGPDSIHVVTAVTNLGAVYGDRGELDLARTMYERAIKVVEAVRGSDHPTLGAILSDLGVIARNQQKLDEAEGLLRRALAIAEKAYGPDHSDVADCLSNLATVYKANGQLDEAETATVRALGIIEKVYGPHHPRLGMALNNFAGLQTARKNFTGAIESYKKSLAVFEAKLGKDHPYVSYPLSGIGNALIELKREAEAVAPLERSLAIREAAGVPPGPVAEVREYLAYALAASPKTRARAIAEITKAIAGWDQAGLAENAVSARDFLRKLRSRR